MKKQLFIFLLVGLTSLQVQAYPVMKYSNKCFLGCGSVFWKTFTYTGPNNVEFTGADVSCKGIGLQGCPRYNVGPSAIGIPDVQLQPWESTPIDDVVNHAWAEMDLGNGNGTYFVNYLNTSTGITYKYTITWNTTYFVDESIDEITYTIDRIEIPISGT